MATKVRVTGSTTVNGKPLTQSAYNSGALVNALLGKPQPASPGPVAASPLKGIGGNNPTPVQPSVQPPDPNVLNQQLIGNRNIALGNADAAYQEGNLGFDFGYNPDGSINAANPYSRAALYQLGYERQQAGTTNSLAARGQLYSGALQNQRGLDASNYAQQDAANRLAYQRGLHGIQTGQLGTVANAGSGVSDADFNALLKSTYPGS